MRSLHKTGKGKWKKRKQEPRLLIRTIYPDFAILDILKIREKVTQKSIDKLANDNL